MGKEYTLENLAMKTVKMTATGNWVDSKGKWDILTFLIQKAGKICKHYASDLFISWSSLENEMKQDGLEYTGGKYLFGFRESGVDHDNYVLSRLNNYGIEGLKRDIQELYMLEVSIDKESLPWCEIRMQLGKIDMDSIEK